MMAKPYGLKEGFLVGGGLIVAGLMLQLSVGPVAWDVFRWPVNGIVLAAFLSVIAAIFLFRRRVYAFRFLGTRQAAIPALAYAVVLTIIMGLTRQDVNDVWFSNMLSFWPFVLIYVYIDVILGLVVLQQLRTVPCSILSHFGLFLALTAATLGHADIQRLKMIAIVDEPERRTFTERGQVVEMPFTIELKQFVMETYADGKPKRFASDVQILLPTGKSVQTTIEVNKPAEVEGWKIYQYGYDTSMGAQSQISILELIRDPWLPLVYVGIYMMLAGALGSILLSVPWRKGLRQVRCHPRRAFSVALLIAAAFVCVHHFMPILHSDTLVPALQSPWFKPHIITYMLAYTLMAAAAVIALCQLFRKNPFTSIYRLVSIGVSLITIGMLFGALWAKEAWGHYWTWDPKETWAAITWLAYLVYVHDRQISTHKPKLALWVLIISFILLQMCWWGINYLPSAQASSIHVYN